MALALRQVADRHRMLTVAAWCSAAAAAVSLIRWLDPAVALIALTLTGAIAVDVGMVTDVRGGPVAVLAVLLVATGLGVRAWFFVLVVRHGDALVGADHTGRHPEGDDDLGLVERPGQSSGW